MDNDADFVELDLDAHQHLDTQLSEATAGHDDDRFTFTKNSDAHLEQHHSQLQNSAFTTDHLLNELSLEDTKGSSNNHDNDNNGRAAESDHVDEHDFVSAPLSSPTEARHTSHYDQLFEEVSLDLPRDASTRYTGSPPPPISTSAKLLKFMPRRNNSLNGQQTSTSPTTSTSATHHINNPASTAPSTDTLKITSADFSGPFYSISDVLSDSPTTTTTAAAAAAAAAAVAATHGTTINTNTPSPSSLLRGAKRNVREKEVVATAGGSNLKGVNRRSSMNPFSRQRNTMKPSPLESVVSKTRPRMLPPKDPSEEKKHLQEHDAMMKKAIQLEIKKQKEHDKKKEEINKKVTHSVNIWEKTILPQWNKKIKEKKVQELWLQGIPPRCRRKVWILAIGNNLNLSKESFSTCANRLPPVTRTHQDPKATKYTSELRTSTRRRIAENDTLPHEPEEPEDDAASFYRHLQGRRTSSLNVLNDDDDYSNKFDDEPLTPQSTTSSLTHSIVYDGKDNASRTSHLSNQAKDRQHHDTASEDDDDSGSDSLDSLDSMKLGDDDDDDDTNDGDDGDNKHDISPGNNDDNNNDLIFDTGTITFLHKAVDEDIVRTLPSLCVFQPDGPLFLSLRKVLHAYIGYRSDLTYTRGASFLAGMLLLNMGTHDTFIGLTNLIHNSPVLSALYRSDEARVKGYFKIFNVIFAEHMPKLYLHFKNLSLTPDNYLPDWLMTLFSSITPLSVSTRLWDIFLLEGDVVLFKTGLVVLKSLEPLLWGGGFSETVRILNMGFVGEQRGEEAKAAVAVSGGITKGEQDQFFHDILGGSGKASSSSIIHLDATKYATLVNTHIPK